MSGFVRVCGNVRPSTAQKVDEEGSRTPDPKGEGLGPTRRAPAPQLPAILLGVWGRGVHVLGLQGRAWAGPPRVGAEGCAPQTLPGELRGGPGP